ncbi:hypothetical protein Tco_1318356 [Tanacetum coccineum]
MMTYLKHCRSDEDFISIGSAEDERLIKRMNEKGVDFSKSEVIKEENFKMRYLKVLTEYFGCFYGFMFNPRLWKMVLEFTAGLEYSELEATWFLSGVHTLVTEEQD